MRKMIEWIKTEDPKANFIRHRNIINYEAEAMCIVDLLKSTLHRAETKRSASRFIHHLYHGLLRFEALLMIKHEKPFYRVAKRNLYFIVYHWEAINDILMHFNPEQICMDDIVKMNYLEDCGFDFSKRLKQRMMIYRLSAEPANV